MAVDPTDVCQKFLAAQRRLLKVLHQGGVLGSRTPDGKDEWILWHLVGKADAILLDRADVVKGHLVNAPRFDSGPCRDVPLGLGRHKVPGRLRVRNGRLPDFFDGTSDRKPVIFRHVKKSGLAVERVYGRAGQLEGFALGRATSELVHCGRDDQRHECERERTSSRRGGRRVEQGTCEEVEELGVPELGAHICLKLE